MRKIFILFAAVFTVFGGIARADELVPLDAPAGAAILNHATASASALPLLRYFETQENTAYCGVASSAIVLNSLALEPPLVPKIFPYRLFTQDNFFTDKVLAIKPAAAVGASGLELEQLAAMLSTYPVKVETYHANQLKSADELRRVASSALSDPGKRVIVNYARKALHQEGGGHISPLAAYDQPSDRFLILDVARYKAPPVWVTTHDLWEAIDTTDTSARKKRGILIIAKP